MGHGEATTGAAGPFIFVRNRKRFGYNTEAISQIVKTKKKGSMPLFLIILDQNFFLA